jgi:hypothetical protein
MMLVAGAIISGLVGIFFSRQERRRDGTVAFQIALADIAALPRDRAFHSTSCHLIRAEFNRLAPLLKPKTRVFCQGILRDYQKIPPEEMCDYSKEEMVNRLSHDNLSPESRFQSYVARFEKALA